MFCSTTSKGWSVYSCSTKGDIEGGEMDCTNEEMVLLSSRAQCYTRLYTPQVTEVFPWGNELLRTLTLILRKMEREIQSSVPLVSAHLTNHCAKWEFGSNCFSFFFVNCLLRSSICCSYGKTIKIQVLEILLFNGRIPWSFQRLKYGMPTFEAHEARLSST